MNEKLILKDIRSTHLYTGLNYGKPITHFEVFNDRVNGVLLSIVDNPTFRLEMPIKDILRVIGDLKGNLDYWLFSNGEPITQLESIANLLAEFRRIYNYLPTVELSLSGAILPEFLFSEGFGYFAENHLLLRVSPKLSTVYNGQVELPEKDRINIVNLKKILNSNIRSYFIFEVGRDSDVQEVKVLIKELKLDSRNVILTLPDLEEKEYIRLRPWLKTICMLGNFAINLK